jgi:nicotinamidase-related amidase
MLIDSDDSQLILIDYQARLLPALSEGTAALANAVRLAQAARLLEVPAWGTEQYPEGLGATDLALRALLQRVFTKRSFSAVPDGLLDGLRPPVPARAGGNARSLPKHLQKPAAPDPGRQTLVVAGCEAHVCLLQTALDLVNEEFDVCVVTDACSSRTERNRDAAFDRLAGAGVELVTTEMVLFEWLRSSDHPHFKAVQALVK